MDEYINVLTKKKNDLKEINKGYILQMMAFQQLEQQKIYPLTIKGIKKEYLDNIENNIKNFESVYLKLQDLTEIDQNIINVSEEKYYNKEMETLKSVKLEKIKVVENFETINQYAQLV